MDDSGFYRREAPLPAAGIPQKKLPAMLNGQEAFSYWISLDPKLYFS
jgi:hypothetical protein